MSKVFDEMMTFIFVFRASHLYMQLFHMVNT